MLGDDRRTAVERPARVACEEMTTAPASSEPTPQRLAAIRDQLKLLADYL
jgi:hypothetical protein